MNEDQTITMVEPANTAQLFLRDIVLYRPEEVTLYFPNLVDFMQDVDGNPILDGRGGIGYAVLIGEVLNLFMADNSIWTGYTTPTKHEGVDDVDGGTLVTFNLLNLALLYPTNGVDPEDDTDE